MHFVKNQYPRSKQPLWSLENRIPSAKEIIAIFPQIKRSSSCGLPWSEIAPTKGIMLDIYSELVIEAVQTRMQLMAQANLVDCTHVSLLDDSICDPVRMFVKNEPHSIAKLAEKRYRLIASCSIIDEIISRLLFGNQVSIELENHQSIPSKPGAGVTTDEQHADLWNYVEPWISKAQSNDVKGWDWSYRKWLYRLVLDSHYVSTSTVVGSLYHKLCECWYQKSLRTVWATSHGQMLTLAFLGVWKSGEFVTAYFNSRGRVLSSILANFPKSLFATDPTFLYLEEFRVMAMGDDCVERDSGYPTRYADLGLRVIAEKPPVGGFSFCSVDFVKGLGVAQNIVKSFFRLMCHDMEPELLQQFLDEYRHHPDLPKWLGVYTLSYQAQGDKPEKLL